MRGEGPRAPRGALFALACLTLGPTSPIALAEAAPAGRYEIDAETVRDTKTGLEWQRRLATDKLTWDEAVARCPTLGARWRLPSIKELQTLVDYGKDVALFDGTAFPWKGDDVNAIVWSATPSRDGAYAYLQSFAKGHTVIYEKTYPESVLCVRTSATSP